VAPEAVRGVDLATLEYEVLAPTNAQRLRRYGRTRPARTVGALLYHFQPFRLAVVYDAVQEEVDHLVEALTRPEGSGYRDLDPVDTSSSALNAAVKEILLEVLSGLEADSPDLARGTRFEDALAALRSDLTLSGLRKLYSSAHPALRRELARRLSEKQSELRSAARGGRSALETIAYAPMSDLAEAGSEYVRFFFTRLVRYLGPLRDDPKPVYPLSGATDPREVGYRGEHTAAVLDLNRNTLVSYVPPDAFGQPDGTPQPRIGGLSEAVLTWLAYLGVAKGVSTADRGKFGHELKVAVGTDTHLHDLTHVGVGVSQVLPILVLSLLADPGSTLVFEQPELHLHPRVQTRLADFFVSLTILGKQTLIETHSEYLVNRLRYRAVVADSRDVADRVLLYFVEKLGQRSTYRPIRITESGTLSAWPQGFFDDSHETAAAILQASIAKRKNRTSK
jgi:predicted ATPase